jgi:large subunit ribosomal protein L9
MSKKVKVILLEDIHNIGRAGDIVEVTEGYARNMLIPQTKAALATTQREKTLRDKKMREENISQAQLAALQSQADALMDTELIITARLKDGEQIYAQVKPAQIIKALNEQAHLKLTAKSISLAGPITSIGTFDATINLSPDVETIIKVTVIPDPKSKPAAVEEDDQQ